MPALQGVHWERELAPGVEEAVPGGQEIQPLEVCPWEGLKVPLGQGRQAEGEFDEGRLLKVPMGQGVQDDNPGVSAKNPALHVVQPVLPVVEEKLPRGHKTQAAERFAPPAIAPRIPMGQGRQDVASLEVYMPCWQIAQDVEPGVRAMLPGAQGEHCVASLAPALLENLPG